MLKPNLIYARVAKCVAVAVFAVAMSGCAQRELMNDDISKMSVLRDNSGGLGLQTLHKRGAFRSHKGSSATYSGSVKVTPLFKTTQWREFSGNLVEFDKGGRTAWHSHPQGQTIIVTRGVIYTATQDGIIGAALPGEVISCPPNVMHWHGAGLSSGGAHIELHGNLNNRSVEWGLWVNDEEYRAFMASYRKRGGRI